MANQAYSRINQTRSSSNTTTASSVPPSYRSRSSNEDSERDHLVDTFGGDDSDSEDEFGGNGGDDRNFGNSLRREREASPKILASSSNEVLFDATDDDNRESSSSSSSSNPTQYEDFETGVVVTRNIRSGSPSNSNSSNDRNAVRGGFLASFWPGRAANGQRRLSSNNDGVFANLTAKPEGTAEKPNGDEENPPSYEEAAADATPPYWETTIMAPGLSDELFIDGLPVGSPVNFAWNMIVSSAFQFVGFFLTYLLHTSHAAKQGSRAGLGITLLQCGFYLQPATMPGGDTPGTGGSGGTPGEFEPSNPNDFDVSLGHSSVSGTYSQVDHHIASSSSDSSSGISATVAETIQNNNNSTKAAGWISTLLMVVGVIIILKSVVDYLQARRMEMAIRRSNNSSQNTVTVAVISEDISDATESVEHLV